MKLKPRLRRWRTDEGPRTQQQVVSGWVDVPRGVGQYLWDALAGEKSADRFVIPKGIGAKSMQSQGIPCQQTGKDKQADCGW